MSGECPPELLEAQTIAARSWLVAAVEQKHADLGLDACNDDCCQRYQGIGNLTEAARSATERTCGQFLLYNNEICDTRYSKSCGGISEHNDNVWDTEPKPYLRGIFDGIQKDIPNLFDTQGLKDWVSNYPDCYCGNNYISGDILKKYLGNVDEKGNYFRWEFTYSQEELTQLISKKTGISFESISSLQPLDRGISGRIIQLQINGISKNRPFQILLESEYEIRRVLHPDFLYSSAFIIIANSDTEPALSEITLKGAGWGHGVGLCQIGALGMALKSKSSKQILSHYFLETELKKLYD
jgi:peptidoglycan hydrolase-like amidase